MRIMMVQRGLAGEGELKYEVGGRIGEPIFRQVRLDLDVDHEDDQPKQEAPNEAAVADCIFFHSSPA